MATPQIYWHNIIATCKTAWLASKQIKFRILPLSVCMENGLLQTILRDRVVLDYEIEITDVEPIIFTVVYKKFGMYEFGALEVYRKTNIAAYKKIMNLSEFYIVDHYKFIIQNSLSAYIKKIARLDLFVNMLLEYGTEEYVLDFLKMNKDSKVLIKLHADLKSMHSRRFDFVLKIHKKCQFNDMAEYVCNYHENKISECFMGSLKSPIMLAIARNNIRAWFDNLYNQYDKQDWFNYALLSENGLFIEYFIEKVDSLTLEGVDYRYLKNINNDKIYDKLTKTGDKIIVGCWTGNLQAILNNQPHLGKLLLYARANGFQEIIQALENI